jgi:general secretion pathway protein N
MIAWLQRRPLLAALSFLAAALVALIALELAFGARWDPAAPASARPASAPDSRVLPPLGSVSPERAYAEVTARPLFTPTRRPAPPDLAGGKPAFARGQFVLQGVIVAGESRTALLKETASGRIHRVESGKDVNGIKVERIEPTQVTLAMGGERETVSLVVQKPAGAAPGAAPATPQGPFGAVAGHPAPAGGAPAAAAAGTQPATAVPHPTPNAAPASGVARAPLTGSAVPPAAGTPSTQPMTPEELLARRRARRNQPTQ